jgi:hypothetical protein
VVADGDGDKVAPVRELRSRPSARELLTRPTRGIACIARCELIAET